jgi:sugar-specific transcriptional regulator TrmB
MNNFELFKDLGFTDYETKVLCSFVKLKKASPKELSLDSGVPRNKIYSILGNFEKENLIEILQVEPKKYRLIDLEGFVKEKIKEKENKVRELRKVSANLEKSSFIEDKFVFSLIRGQKAIMNKLVEINKTASKEILGVQRNWKYWGGGIRAMEESVKRGVKVKFIGVVDNKTIDKVKEWKKIGVKIRAYNRKFGEYPLRFSVFDGKYARITIGKPEVSHGKDYITILTDSKPLVRMLRNQFMQMWKECEKF